MDNEFELEDMNIDFDLSDEISSEKFKDTFDDITEEYKNHKEESYVSSYTCGYVSMRYDQMNINKYIMIHATGDKNNKLFLLSDKVMQDLSEKINNM